MQSERERGSGGDRDGVNKPFVCPSAVLPGLAWCSVPGIQGNFLSYRPLPSVHLHFQCSKGNTDCVRARLLACLLISSLIMQGLGKTERGEQGRDIDLTSLRSTMPASGPLQVSTPRTRERERKERETGGERLSQVRPETGGKTSKSVNHQIGQIGLSCFCLSVSSGLTALSSQLFPPLS